METGISVTAQSARSPTADDLAFRAGADPETQYQEFSRLLEQFQLATRTHALSPLEMLAALNAAWKAVCTIPCARANAARVELLLLFSREFHLSADFQNSLSASTQAVDVARALGDRILLRRSLTSLSGAYTESGNYAGAIEAAAEGIATIGEGDDERGRCRLLVNTGAAMMQSGQYDEAIDCFEGAFALLDPSPANAALRVATLGNIALAHLNLDDIRSALRAARRATEEPLVLDSPFARYARVNAETHLVRVLLETGNIEKAKERCRILRQITAEDASGLDRFTVELAEGLTEIHDGRQDIGFSRLRRLLQMSKGPVSNRQETVLRALVSANEGVGNVDEALVYLKQLMSVVRAQREQCALLHHRRHIARLHETEFAGISHERLLERKEMMLEGQLASRRYRELSTESLERLAVTAELRDDSTGEHSYRVGLLASLLARELGFDEEFVFNLDLAGRLHDIGKIGIPDHILLKPGRLSDIEYNLMKTHTSVGAELLARSELPQMQTAEEIAHFHHERWDGLGYPHGLAGEDIPLAARITALADVFDALTHVRPYKVAWSIAASLEEVERLAGSHFDPQMTPVFIALVHRLMREHGDLDAYLGQAACRSSFIQARRNIAATLHGRGDPRKLDVRR